MSCSRPILNKPSKANAANPNKTKNVNQEYRPIKIIGQGAFGVVYVARMPDGKFVAIKKVLQDPSSILIIFKIFQFNPDKVGLELV